MTRNKIILLTTIVIFCIFSLGLAIPHLMSNGLKTYSDPGREFGNMALEEAELFLDNPLQMFASQKFQIEKIENTENGLHAIVIARTFFGIVMAKVEVMSDGSARIYR